MATGKITKEAVEGLPPPPLGKRAYLWDETLKGFGVMVTDRAVRSYIIQYRMGGRGTATRRVTIGKHGSPWTPKRARDRAAELLEQVRRKVDPFDAQRAVVAAAQADREASVVARKTAEKLAFSTFADRYVEKYAKANQPKTWRDTESVIRRDLKPYFVDKPVTKITAPEIDELLEQVAERGESASLKAYKAMRGVMTYAFERHLIPASPMASMKPPAKVAKRDRSLSDNELRLVWLAAGSLGYPFGPLIRLLILTGQRLREVAELPWAELNLPERKWLLPANRTKNGVATLVPLSDPAMSIVTDLPRIKSDAGKGKPLIAFTTTGDTPVSGFSKIKGRLDATMLEIARKEARDAGADDDAVAALAIEHWQFHDLRRTLASGCQRLGVKLEVSEAILNHVSGTKSGIAGVYHVYKYEDEKRSALDAWARIVNNAVSSADSDNVFRLSAVR